MDFIAPPPIGFRIGQTLDGLCRAVAARIKGGAMSSVMILLVWQRVRRADRRIQGLLARFLAGRLWTRQGEVRVRTSGSGRRNGEVKGRLPRGFGWLCPLVPSDAACFGSQLRVCLEAPEMVALLAASPQARRVLRPICWMLAVEASVLVPVPTPALVAVERATGGLKPSSAVPPQENVELENLTKIRPVVRSRDGPGSAG